METTSASTSAGKYAPKILTVRLWGTQVQYIRYAKYHELVTSGRYFIAFASFHWTPRLRMHRRGIHWSRYSLWWGREPEHRP